MKIKTMALKLTLSGFIAVLMLTACSSKNGYEVLSEGITKVAQETSLEYTGHLKVKLNTEKMKSAAIPAEAKVLTQVFNDAEITYDGEYDKKQMYQKINMKIITHGDVSLEINIPMIIKGNVSYLKVPSASYLPLPKELAGKYIKDTVNGLDLNIPNSPELLNKFSTEVGSLINEHYADNFIQSDEAKPEDVKNLTEFEITDTMLDKEVTELVSNVLPKYLDLLSKPEYASLKGPKPNEILSYKEKLKTFPDQYQSIRKNFKVNELKLLLGSDDAGRLNYYKQRVDVTITNEQIGSLVAAIDMDLKAKNFGKSIEVSVPDDKDTISMEELQNLQSK